MVGEANSLQAAKIYQSTGKLGRVIQTEFNLYKCKPLHFRRLNKGRT